jgi:hypothetical protein
VADNNAAPAQHTTGRETELKKNKFMEVCAAVARTPIVQCRIVGCTTAR